MQEHVLFIEAVDIHKRRKEFYDEPYSSRLSWC